MPNFTRGNNGGGGGGGGNRSDFRPSGGRSFDNRDSRPVVMHDAVCSNCGKKCEVPFRPTGDKPVYCRDCFAKKGAPMGDRSNQRDRRDFAPSSQSRAGSPSGGGNDEIKKQLESVNAKLERLISAVQALSLFGEASKKTSVKTVSKKPAKKSK